MSVRVCSCCGKTKAKSLFSSGAQCKVCIAIKAKNRRLANLEKYKATVNAYKLSNQDAVKVSVKRWREKNKEKLIEYSAEQYSKNREYFSKKSRLWSIENRGEKLALASERRAKKRAAIPKWYGILDKFVLAEAHALASQRGVITGIKWHVDHIVPLKSKRVCGLHCASNFQVIPAKENLRKKNSIWPDQP